MTFKEIDMRISGENKNRKMWMLHYQDLVTDEPFNRMVCARSPSLANMYANYVCDDEVEAVVSIERLDRLWEHDLMPVLIFGEPVAYEMTHVDPEVLLKSLTEAMEEVGYRGEIIICKSNADGEVEQKVAQIG